MTLMPLAPADGAAHRRSRLKTRQKVRESTSRRPEPHPEPPPRGPPRVGAARVHGRGLRLRAHARRRRRHGRHRGRGLRQRPQLARRHRHPRGVRGLRQLRQGRAQARLALLGPPRGLRALPGPGHGVVRRAGRRGLVRAPRVHALLSRVPAGGHRLALHRVRRGCRADRGRPQRRLRRRPRPRARRARGTRRTSASSTRTRSSTRR